MHCAKCGTEVQPGFNFCKSCGAPVGAAAEPLEAAANAASPAAQAVPGVPAATAAAPQIPVAPATYQAPVPAAHQVPQAGVAQPVYYLNPQAVAHTMQQMNLLQSLRGRIQSLASTESLDGFSLRQMFSDVFKKRGAAAVEDYILCGTSKTTPPIELVEAGWPKPWLFFRVLAALVVAYLALTFMFMKSGADNCVPGMIFLGAFAVPLATLTLFFELNTPRNVSIHAVVKLFLIGAVVSLGLAVFIEPLPMFSISTMEAGPVEETAKLLAVVFVMRSVRYKYILNGILFGATVGAGFAAFETAGYGLNAGFLSGFVQVIAQTGSLSKHAQAAAMHQGVVAMLQVLRVRGIESPLGHVAWTALSAGAFWRVKQGKPLNLLMLFDTRFLKAFIIPVSMHAIWDAPWQLPFDGNYILTGLITWYVVFGLVQQGLRQVQEQQKTHLETTLASVEAQLQPPGTVAV
jgi:RsiW-degrading membrane proteinase PrsW (M82 family)